MPMTKDEVFAKVKEVLISTLAVDDAEVTPQAKLSTDLNAESIDYLDITFQLEKTFGIKVPPGDLFPQSLFTDPEYAQNGKITPKGIAELKARMPFADFSAFEADPDINKFRDIFTVDTLVNFVMSKVKG
jgi:acyl carrier protein